jgi:tetratricopeptide (TPR) repeat protein
MIRARPRIASEDAHDAYLVGRHYWAMRTPGALYKSIDHFKRAIKLDPNYALAYAGLADAWGVLPYYVPGPYHQMHAKGKEAAERALALGESLAEAHLSMGLVLENRYDLRTADEHFQKAVELDPNNATAHYWYGYTRCILGHPDEGVAEYRRAISLDPVYAPARWAFGEVLIELRRYEEAEDQIKKAIELQPGYMNAHRDLVWSYLGQDRTADAVVAFEDYLRLLGYSAEEITEFRRLASEPGLCAAIKNWLASMSSDTETSLLSAWNRAKYYAWCGDKDNAFKFLDQAWKRADPSLSSVRHSPSLDNLRDDSRYQALLSQLDARQDYQEARPP